METPQILTTPIPIDTYRNLRVRCGLSAKTEEAARIGLHNTLYSVMLQDDGQIIGMGRLIGDGGCFCQIVDICVLPDYQRQGLGRVIMGKLTDYIREELPESCYISLLADGGASYLYEKFGFRDTMPASKGMYLKK